jgi:MoaA/NifB/PqqE/SkfB family radical SAM enzyme
MSGTPDLLSSIQSRAESQSIPLNATIELTLSCNLSCAHCYNFDRTDSRQNRRPGRPLEFEEICSSIDQLREMGTLFLGLSGGEPMMHPRFFDLVEYAIESGLAVQVLTNGTFLSYGSASRLKSAGGVYGVSVSIYGGSAETHDAFTGVAGSWQKAWDGVRCAKREGLSVLLKFILTRHNVHEVEMMVAQADDVDCPRVLDPTITGRHDGSTSSVDVRIPTEDLESLYRGPLGAWVGDAGACQSADEFACNCARGNLGITLFGGVQPCISVPLELGNIRSQSLVEIWNSPKANEIRKLGLSDYPDCSPCPDRAHCRRSPGASVMVSGRMTGVDPWVCAEAEVLHRLAREKIEV